MDITLRSSVFSTQSKRRRFKWGGSKRLNSLANAMAQRGRDVYEFGVYTGGSMRGLVQAIHGFGTLYGFDSFQGVPDETPGVRIPQHWKVGAYSAAFTPAFPRA